MLERLSAGGEQGDKGWDGWMHHWLNGLWASSGRWWRTGVPGVLQSMRLQRVRHNWVIEQQQLLGSGRAAIWTQMTEQQQSSYGLPRAASCKETACQYRNWRRHRFSPWVEKIPWKRAWKPTAVFLPGESHRWRSFAGYSPLSHKDLDTTEAT